MASKNSYSIDDILNEYSSEGVSIIRNSSENEKTSENVPAETEDNGETAGETALSDDIQEENISEYTEPIIPDESDFSSVSDESVSETETEEDIMQESDESADTDEEEYSSRRRSFSYRSTAKSESRQSRTVRNPEDNIRYLRRDRDIYSGSSDSKTSGKKKSSGFAETKSDISSLENIGSEDSFTTKNNSIREKIKELKNELFGSKSISEKKQNIDLKSVPEVDYFSIDVDINEGSDSSEKSSGFFRKINKSFEKTAENNLDDYNAPGDASLILEDLYSLKGNLTAKFFIQFAAVLASIYLSASALYDVPVPSFLSSIDSPHKYSITLFIISALVLFSSFPMVIGGFKSLFRKKADCDTLAAVSITLCTVAAAISTESPDMIQSGSIYIYTPVAVTAFLVNTIGKHLIVNRAINNFDMLISTHDKHSLIYVDDEARAEQITRGVVSDYPILAATRKTGFAQDFLKYTYSSDIADKMCRKYVPASIVTSVILTLLSVIICSQNTNTLSFTYISSALSMFFSLFTCFGIPVVVNLPLSAAASEAEYNESIILGYQSIDDFYDTNALVVDAAQLFPDYSQKLCSIKMFSDTRIDDAIIAAASIVKKSGSIFSDMFSRIVDYNDDLLEDVENFSYEDTLGLCGWIKNKRILFGNRQLMINHNIEGIPPKSKENDMTENGCIPMYLSVSGNLAAIFVIKLKADPAVSEQVSDITSNGISLIIKSIDSAVTVTRTARLFGIPEDMVKIASYEQKEYCDKITAPAEKSSSSVICTSTLSSAAKAVSNIKYIHHSSLTALVLQSTSAVLAVIFAVIFMIIGMTGQMTPLMLILYHTVWIMVTLLIVKIKPR
ncbi:MAG: hypothetical protein MSH15_03655 [Oscillospiraceae bacterium]|nr:hypothetical protein [Oscillospiraceae bacterium]